MSFWTADLFIEGPVNLRVERLAHPCPDGYFIPLSSSNQPYCRPKSPILTSPNRIHAQVFVIPDNLRGDGELIVLLMSEPEPPPDLREDVLHPFPIAQLVEDDDLVVSELIAIGVVCHGGFSFLD